MEIDFTLKYVKYKTPRIIYILFHFENINTTLDLHDTCHRSLQIKRSIKTNHRQRPNFTVKLTERLLYSLLFIFIKCSKDNLFLRLVHRNYAARFLYIFFTFIFFIFIFILYLCFFFFLIQDTGVKYYKRNRRIERGSHSNRKQTQKLDVSSRYIAIRPI